MTETTQPIELPPDRPVFVDPTGRRRRVVNRATIIGTAVLGIGGALVAGALLGAPIVPSARLPAPPVAELPAPATTAPTGSAQQVVRPPSPPSVDATPDTTRATHDSVTTTAVIPPPVTTAVTTKVSKDHTTGRPTELPAPPGHSR